MAVLSGSGFDQNHNVGNILVSASREHQQMSQSMWAQGVVGLRGDTEDSQRGDWVHSHPDRQYHESD